MKRAPFGKGGFALVGIDFVEKQNLGFATGADVFQNLMDRSVLLLGVGVADVEHVQQQVGMDRFLKRGLEAGDEIVVKIADEADGVAEEYFRAALKTPGARLCVQ